MKVISTIICAGVLFQAGAQQFNGTWVSTFGSGGKVFMDHDKALGNDHLGKLKLDKANNALFYCGWSDGAANYDPFIGKFDSNGQLDSIDPNNGYIFYDLAADDDYFHSMDIQSDGKIVAVGQAKTTAGECMYTRYNADGLFDNSFGSGGGLNFYNFPSFANGKDSINDVFVQSDGKILVVGSLQVGASDYDCFVFRFNSDGTFDGTFGAGLNGKVGINSITGNETLTSVTVLSNGKIVVGGISGAYGFMAMLTANGELDTSFSVDGMATLTSLDTDPNTTSSVKKVMEMTDGNILVAGNITRPQLTDGNNGFLMKVLLNGNLPLNFGNNSVFEAAIDVVPAGDSAFYLHDVEYLTTGQLLISGDYLVGSTSEIGFILADNDGQLVTTFGTNGVMKHNLSGGSLDNQETQIEVAANGQVYVATRIWKSATDADIVFAKLAAPVSDPNPSAVNDVMEGHALNVYPNPVTDRLYVSLPAEMMEGQVSITVFDMNGQVAFSQNVQPSNATNIDLGSVKNLPNGVYMIKANTSQSVYNARFIKQ